jgi:hypothetical protein
MTYVHLGKTKGVERMKRTMASALGIFMIGIMALLVPVTHATQGPTATEDNQGNRIIFTAGSLTAEFEGMVPKVKFYDHTQTMIRVEQQVNFRSLIEFNDADGDKVFQTNEKVFQVTLDEARWTHTISSLPGGSGLNVTFTLADPASVGLTGSTVILAVKAYNTTQSIIVDGKSAVIATAEIKFDVVVKNWPFQSPSNMLALQVNLHSSTEHLDFDEQGGTVGVDASHDEGAQTAEHQFRETSNVEQETRFSSGLVTTSSTVGFFRFVNKATVTPTTGSPYSVNVTASYKSEAENDAGDRETFMKLYLAYPSFQGTLTHDPSIGLGGGLPTLYFIVGGVAVAGLLAVVAIRRRHPQVQKDSKQK